MPKKLARTLFTFLGLLIGVGLFAFLVYTSGPQDILKSLLSFGVLPLFGFILLSLVNFTLYSLRWKLILDVMVTEAQRVPFHRMFMHRMSGFAAGYLTPGAQVAGEPIRVAMLHADGIPVKEATSSVVLDLAFEITTFVLYVALGLGFALTHGLGGGASVTWSLLFISVVLIIMIGFFVTTITGSGFFHRALSITRLNRFPSMKALEHWLIETEDLMSQFFVKRTGLIILVISLSLIMATFKAIEAIYISHFFGVNVRIADAFLMSTLPGVALLLPVPGGLGVFEGSNGALFALLKLEMNPVAYTMIVRVRDFVFIAIGTMHAIVHGELVLARMYGKRS